MFRIPQIYSFSELVAAGGTLNGVNDPVAGGSIPAGNLTGGTANQQNLRAGQVGFTVEVNAAQALQLSNTSVGTLYQGWYMYVKSATAGVRGCAAFVSSLANAGDYIVTGDSATAATLLRPVGVYLNTVTAGYYTWIQIRGLASLQFVTAITNETDGYPVKIVDQSGTGRGEQVSADFAAGTPSSIATMSPYMRAGIIAAELPVDNSISRVWLNPPAFLI
jgi:hypothetical protein